MFVAQLDMRTRSFRSQLLELATKAQNLADELFDYPGAPRHEFEVKPGHESLYHARFMLDRKVLADGAERLRRHIWMLGVNKTGVPLYTSDSPIARKAHVLDFKKSYLGIDARGVELNVPLSPEHLLILLERSHHAPEEKYDGRVIDLDERRVVSCNRRQVTQSTRQVFARSNGFADAARLCTRYPEICHPDRPYVQVIERGDIVHFKRIR